MGTGLEEDHRSRVYVRYKINSLFAEGTHSCFQILKVIKIHQDFSELWSQMYSIYWPCFYGSQCIFDFDCTFAFPVTKWLSVWNICRTRSHWRVCVCAWHGSLTTITSTRKSWKKSLHRSCLSMSSSWSVHSSMWLCLLTVIKHYLSLFIDDLLTKPHNVWEWHSAVCRPIVRSAKKCKVIYRKALSALWLYLSGKTKWSFNENSPAVNYSGHFYRATLC